MKLLICNIGSSDLDRKKLSELRDLSERARSQRILNDIATYLPRLDLPIIGKALRYVQRQPGKLVRIVLIASNQSEEPPLEPEARGFWESDTCWTVEVVKRCLTESLNGWQATPTDRIDIWLIGDNGSQRDPSDYDGVRRYFEQRLPELQASFPDATVYLEVTGGTPAMTTGLLVAGTEVFGAQAEALYVNQREEIPATLNTARRLQSRPLRSALLANVKTYDYGAAGLLLKEQASVIGDRLEKDAMAVLECLLTYAACRFNFDFPGARRALEGKFGLADGTWADELQELVRAVKMPDRAAKLAEVYHGASMRYDVHAYADFLTQVVRFQENAFRMLCLERGVVFVNSRGQKTDTGHWLQQDWVSSMGLPSSINLEMTRGNMRDLLRQLARQRNKNLDDQPNKNLDGTIRELNRLDALANLRNELVHTFEGVDRLALAWRFAGNRSHERKADEIVPHMQTCYMLVADRQVGPSPFMGINQIIHTLLREVST